MSVTLNSTNARFIIVGSGKTAVDIAQIITTNEQANLVALLGDSRKDTSQSSLPNEADKLGIPYLETKTLSDERALDFVKESRPDYIISANNFLLFRQPMLDIPAISTINFHNGPLPQYAGLNPFSWAIINGEEQYGISWHEVETGIDSGSVLHIAEFDMGPRTQAITLMIKCIREGIQSFKEQVLPKLVNREVNGTAQDQNLRRYYSKNDVPYAGLLPWWESQDKLQRWARSLAFSPLPNTFYRPILETGDGTKVVVERVRYQDTSQAEKPGVITKIDDDLIIISTQNGEILVDGFHTENNEPIDLTLIKLSVGDQLIEVKPR